MISVALNRRSEEASDKAPRVNVVAIAILLVAVGLGLVGWNATGNPVPLVVMALLGLALMQAPRIAQQWERAVVLRLGRFIGLRGPGLFWIVPFIDRVSSWIDQRTITTTFAAEQTLTADTVPVNVDAVLFWMVHDAEKAALEVQDYAAGGELGGADGAARHHRPHHAHRSAARPRADRMRSSSP